MIKNNGDKIMKKLIMLSIFALSSGIAMGMNGAPKTPVSVCQSEGCGRDFNVPLDNTPKNEPKKLTAAQIAKMESLRSVGHVIISGHN
jgi:hypothetical protein